jgi:glyoxylase-like metal-dependent hydrolase (beta-lactamase superfamily II)
MVEATSWEIGAVKITCVVEVAWGFPPGVLSTDLTAERVKKIEWLRPHYAGEDGTLFLNVQAFVLESRGKKIIVDTCIGNDKKRKTPSYNMLALPFLEQLKKAGHPVESIDYVLCTHLHIDHIGWNTRWDGKGWVPTFPNARYLFSRIDWEELSHMEDRPEFADSLLPIAEAGLHQFIDANHVITEEISLFPTPGHTRSHASVAIRSQWKEAVITGDLAHSPIQFADPEICTNFGDFDRKIALETRKKFIHDHADKDVVIFGTHFNTPSAGRIVRDKDAWRFVPAEQSVLRS